MTPVTPRDPEMLDLLAAALNLRPTPEDGRQPAYDAQASFALANYIRTLAPGIVKDLELQADEQELRRVLPGLDPDSPPVFGMVRKRDAFVRTGKDHAVIADNGAAPQRSKADIAGPSRSGKAIAAARRALLERDLAAGGSGLAKHQGRTRRRIDLGLVVHFQDLDVEVFVQRLRHALHQRRQQIDAEAHIA